MTFIEYRVPGAVLGWISFLLLLLTDYHKLRSSDKTLPLFRGSIGQKSEVLLG